MVDIVLDSVLSWSQEQWGICQRVGTQKMHLVVDAKMEHFMDYDMTRDTRESARGLGCLKVCLYHAQSNKIDG